MGRIFLSYAREDRAVAERLASLLSNSGYDIWWDRNLVGGEEFADEIERELDSADVVLVAWSANSVRSRWVRDEASIGGDTNRLVPVSIDGTLAPMGFRQFQSVDMAGWKGAKNRQAAELIAAVERRLTGETDARNKRGPTLELPPATTARPLWIGGVLALVIAAAIGTYFALGMNRAAELAPTIALLPVSAASNDESQRTLAAEIRDSLMHRLSQSDLSIRSVEVPSANPEIVGDYVLSGEVSQNGDNLVATIRLGETAHGITVFSKRFEAKEDDRADFVERIGVQIAGNLNWAAPLMALEKRRPSDPVVLADLIRQLDFTSNSMQLQSYQAGRRAAARAPKSAFAQVSLAMNTGLVLEMIPGAERGQAVLAARKAADRAIELAPEFGDVRASWCFLHSETYWTECENRLREAKRIDPDAPFVDFFLSGILRATGRIQESIELTRSSYIHDPYVPTKIGWMLRSHEFAGERKAADELFENGLTWWPEFAGQLARGRALGLLARGDFESIGRIEQEVLEDGLPTPYPFSSEPIAAAIKGRSSESIREYCSRSGDNWYFLEARCLIALAQLGDLDKAFAIADRLWPNRVGRNEAETERIWLAHPEYTSPELLSYPSALALRRDPRFIPIAERLGLLAYWRGGRLPDFCSPPGEPVCAQFKRR